MLILFQRTFWRKWFMLECNLPRLGLAPGWQFLLHLVRGSWFLCALQESVINPQRNPGNTRSISHNFVYRKYRQVHESSGWGRSGKLQVSQLKILCRWRGESKQSTDTKMERKNRSGTHRRLWAYGNCMLFKIILAVLIRVRACSHLNALNSTLLILNPLKINN